MSKLIPMDEAAGILGMTEDQVAELRSNNEIFGYRDGATWKFKMSELERVADELGLTLSTGGSAIDAVKGKIDDAVSELGLSFEDSDDDLVLDEPDSVELLEDSSIELFSGSLDDAASASDSMSVSASSLKLDDLKLLDDDDDDSFELGESSAILKSDSDKPAASAESKGKPAAADSDKPAAPAENKKADDSINLSSSSIFDSEEALSFGSSLKLSDDADKGSDATELVLADETMSSADGGSGTGKDLDVAGADDLLLVDDDDDDALSLEDSVSFEDSADLGVQMASAGDDEMLLDDSDSSIDLKLETDDNGINLAISESGISLSSDEPLELGGSEIDALQLDDDDDDVIMVEEEADQDDPTLMQEDDFNLTPLEESAPVADSTSQVIAMEDSAVFADESVATVMGDGDFETDVVDDAGFGDGFGDDGLGEDGLYEDSALAGAGAGVAMVPEVSYSKWQLISLGLVSTLLLAGSLVAYDLARNLWMPDNQTVGRGVLKFFLGLVNMD
ncbi:helix-turn-helix domain-containing protein [Mariniblastus sp.]|nr:helix-turn-helix domain-containing protein [Mariniblastus sp.]